jgi:hypothetical protein
MDLCASWQPDVVNLCEGWQPDVMDLFAGWQPDTSLRVECWNSHRNATCCDRWVVSQVWVGRAGALTISCKKMPNSLSGIGASSK